MEENIKYIPARLKNATKGGHIAGTDDIIDDISGKNQSEINTEVNSSIEKIKSKVGDFIPKNRGEYAEGERYYEGNLTQYKGGTYIAHPLDYDVDTNPLAYVTDPPFNLDPEILNPGWGVFARGYNAETSGGVTNVAWDDNKKAIVQVIEGESSNVVTVDKLKEEIKTKFRYNEDTETLEIS